MNQRNRAQLFEAINVKDPAAYAGYLKLTVGDGNKIYTGHNAKLLLPLLVAACVSTNEKAALNWYDEMMTDNGGQFPVDELVANLEVELAPHAGEIKLQTGRNSINIAVLINASKVLDIHRKKRAQVIEE